MTDPAGPTQLHELGVGEMLDAQAAEQATAVDLLEACVARIEATDNQVHAFVTLDLDSARAAAQASATRWRTGTPRSLEGVPFAVKDVIATATLRTSLGSRRYEHWIPEHSAESVRRLQAAGAVLVGKVATPEWSFGETLAEHNATNPWNAAHWTGASSSGPAATLAARQVPLALGTDTTGSIRVPASYCGVSGLLSTADRISRGGVVPVSWTLDHTGPMARSATDLHRAFTVLARDSPPPLPERPSLTGKTIGVLRDWFRTDTDPHVLAATDDALAAMAAAGAKLVDVSLPSAELAGVAAYVISFAEFAAQHADAIDHVDEYSGAALDRIALGHEISAPDYLHALRMRSVVQAELDVAFARCDVLVSPATPTTAPVLHPEPHPMFSEGHAFWLNRVARTLLTWSVAGAPAVVVPSGFDPAGLPTAIQIGARPQHDELALEVAAAYQLITDHHRALPPL